MTERQADPVKDALASGDYSKICSAQLGRVCGVRGKDGRKTAAPLMCPEPAVSFYTNGTKTIGRCKEHDRVDLANPKNAGWRKVEQSEAQRA